MDKKSLIGEYVHYRRKNYERCGISRDGLFEKFDYNGYKEKIQGKLSPTAWATNENKQRVESSLNAIFSNNKDIPPDVAAIRVAIEQNLLERFGNAVGKIDWSTGNITKSNSFKSKGEIEKQMNDIIRSSKDQQKIRLSTLMKRVDTILTIMDNIKDVKKKDELKVKINDITALFNKILSSHKTELKQADLGTTVKQLLNNNEQQMNQVLLSLKGKHSGKVWNLITAINQTIADYHVGSLIPYQKGELLELAAAYCPAVGAKCALEEFNNLLKDLSSSAVGSSDKKAPKIDLEYFAEDFQDLSLKGWSKEGNFLISSKASQNKVDITLQWEDTPSFINISAKNVNLQSKYGIHILSKSPLLYLIQNEDAAFVNHYLNIIANHPEDGAITERQAQVALAHETMKYAIIFKAFTGKTVGKEGKNASIFLVNDNSTINGGIKVYDLSDVIEKAKDHLSSFDVTANNLSLESLSNSLNNSYAPQGPEARITRLLQEVHSQKISVAFNSSFLSKI